jgi:hypothetical protein
MMMMTKLHAQKIDTPQTAVMAMTRLMYNRLFSPFCLFSPEDAVPAYNRLSPVSRATGYVR